MLADESIIKLVFLRERPQAGAAGARKAVVRAAVPLRPCTPPRCATPHTRCRALAQVPLVEGADFDQFLARVRRRLNLPESATVALRDEGGARVDSIERLLEVDESTTLMVDSDTPSSAAGGAPPSASRLRGGARGPASPGGAAGGASGAAGGGTCRVDIPVTEWARGGRRGDDESGDLKYKKRRSLAVNLQRLRLPIIIVSLLLGAAVVGVRVYARA